jgi:TP53 regulating kinase-like protein
MDFVDSPTMRDYINSVRDLADQKDALAAALGEIGRIIAAMHDMGVIHGDLTTSNMMRQGDGQIVVIDFGLASSSSNTEDKAVDLYVLERAFTSTHCHSDALFQLVMDGYAAASTKADVTLRKFKDVKLRGRKRSMLG